MLACKGIFATPSIDTAVNRPQKAEMLLEFYEIKFCMCQLYHIKTKMTTLVTVLSFLLDENMIKSSR